MGASSGSRGDGRVQARLGVLVVLFVLLLAAREARWPAAHPPLPHPSRSTPFYSDSPGSGSPGAVLPSLDQLTRRYVGEGYVLEVIYANPLLPSDEATTPIFRIVAIYRDTGTHAGQAGLPADLGYKAQVRTSDGRLQENLLWQEEIRLRRRVLGYLSCRPGSLGERRPLLTDRTRWVELSLAGLAEHPLRFRWTMPDGRW
ncbi:MAG TPA: hypothetical protein GXX28_08145 [Firmicutes bacterium]|nr:hypothetical protein [Bacillota bacterium]